MQTEIASWHNSDTIIIETSGKINSLDDYERHSARVMDMIGIANLPNIIVDNRDLIVPKLPSTHSGIAHFLTSQPRKTSSLNRIIVISSKEQKILSDYWAHHMREYGIHVDVYTSLVLAMNELIK